LYRLDNVTGGLAAFQVNHGFEIGQLLQDALQGEANIMRRFRELQRRARANIHPNDFGFDLNVGVLMREAELQLGSR
jgi:hypothetical protein